MSVHGTYEILRRKMDFRILARGHVTSRDLYDFVVAACMEPDTTDRVMWYMDDFALERVESVIVQHERDKKPLLDPHVPKIANNLAHYAVQLFRVGAEEFNRRHGDLVRKLP